MRGEETQMIGFLQRHPSFKGQICMPGTHSKWARVKRQRIESFRTYMTGEMFDLLSNQSVLRHSVDTGWNADAFRTAFLQTYRAPADLTRLLFGVRAGDLLHGWPAGAGRAHLSGLLIGAEFANEAIEGETVGLIGTGSLTQIYRAAMALAGIRPVTLDSAEAVRSGLVAARRALTSET